MWTALRAALPLLLAAAVICAIALPLVLAPRGGPRTTGAPVALLRPTPAPGAVRVLTHVRDDVAHVALSLDTPLTPGALPGPTARISVSTLARATFSGVPTGEHTVYGAALGPDGRVLPPVTARGAANYSVGGTWCGPQGTPPLFFTPQGGSVVALARSVDATLTHSGTFCTQEGAIGSCHDGSGFTVRAGDALVWTPAHGTPVPTPPTPPIAFTRASIAISSTACNTH